MQYFRAGRRCDRLRRCLGLLGTSAPDRLGRSGKGVRKGSVETPRRRPCGPGLTPPDPGYARPSGLLCSGLLDHTATAFIGGLEDETSSTPGPGRNRFRVLTGMLQK